MKKLSLVIIASLFVAGCGGGGGGGASIVSEWLGTDPNAVISTKTNVTYDLRHGTPDQNGAANVAAYNNVQTIPTTATQESRFDAIPWFGRTLASYNSDTELYLIKPNSDVTSAWSAGWTGKGINILITDDCRHFNSGIPQNIHAGITSFIAGRYIAPGANTYLTHWDLASPVYDTNNNAITADKKIQVVNASWDSDTQAVDATQMRDVFSGRKILEHIDLTDAVITKAAGNAHSDADVQVTNVNLAMDPATASRTLIVGALDYDTNGKASIADYSNLAGYNSYVQARFLVANGNVPFASDIDFAYLGNVSSATIASLKQQGTSFAAPRVAGYAAIIRQKFPNLTAVNTADILLQTARYDTLKCYPNCDKAVYGQGEASLSRALAPVGYLR